MYNKELEIIDDCYKAYLLGLFYSDGCISNKFNRCVIALHNKDAKILYDLNSIFPFFKVCFIPQKNQTVLLCTNRQLKIDFINNGCYPIKSTTNKELLRVPKNTQFLSHFIRGYFDGNGGCCLGISKGKIQKRVYIYSASSTFIEDVRELLLSNNIYTTVANTKGVYKLTISTKSYRNFYDYIYMDNSIKIERKYNKFNQIFQTNFFTQMTEIKCPKCNSYHTVHHGFYRYKEDTKQTVLCRSCGKVSAINTAPINSNVE